MRDDDDPEKWGMKGQTRVKHRLLEKYLDPWFNKITTVSSEVEFLDGFAGRGEYTDGEIGSPIIAMDVADRKLDAEPTFNAKLDNFRVIAVEDDDTNHSNLKRCISRKADTTDDRITTETHNTTFAEYAEEYIDSRSRFANPSFVFIDPFGFSGVPLETIHDIINLRPTGIEVFITFMSGKMARFLSNDSHQQAIDEAFGTQDWRDHIDEEASKEKRAEQLLIYYEERLREEADISYVWPFKMNEEDKRQTSYHLVHATNHFDGFELMKGVMWSEGAADTFSYLGPDHYPYESGQKALSAFNAGGSDEEVWIEELSEDLMEEYRGRQVKFDTLLREQYPKTPFIQKHFRNACMNLSERCDVRIHNFPNRQDGNEYGIGRDDEIEFLNSQQSSLDAF